MEQFEAETILLQIHKDIEKLRSEVSSLHSYLSGVFGHDDSELVIDYLPKDSV